MRKLSALLCFSRLFEADPALLPATLSLVRPRAPRPRRWFDCRRALTHLARARANTRTRTRARFFSGVGPAHLKKKKQIFAAASTQDPSIAAAGGSMSWGMTPVLLSVRRKACSILVQLAHDIPMTLVPLFDSLSSMASRRFEAADTTENEKTFLIEALVLVSHATPATDSRRRFPATMCERLVAEMGSPAVVATLASTESFMTGIGMAELCRRGACLPLFE